MTAAAHGCSLVRVSSPASDTLAMPPVPVPPPSPPQGLAVVPAPPLRRASRKFTRARPSDAEQARREAWGEKWGALNRAAINQAMEGLR